MKKTLITITLITTIFTVGAQTEVDALRHSQQDIFGNARFAAMSGAFGALGGEFSSLSYNPAGIGMYQFSEFTFTPSFTLHNSKSYSNTESLDENKMGLNISNLGLVYSMSTNNSGWKRINIALGWNQLASYDRHIRIQVENSSSSLAEKILENAIAQGTINNLDGLYSWPAWDTYLIDTIPGTGDNGDYFLNLNPNTKKMKSKSIHSTGSENEFVFSIGGSYNEQLYVGATVGLPIIHYYERSTYTEDFGDTINGLQEFNFKEELSVYGSGINLKVGAMIRIAEQLKLGAAFHTPTFYSMEETYLTSITTHFDTARFTGNGGYSIPIEYDLMTPWKAILSASTIFNKNIIISADYEIVDYTFSEMSSYDYAFEIENEAIKDKYTKTANIRLGAEVNIQPFILRGGYSKYGSALANTDFSRENISCGLGLNNGSYFFDAAYVLSQGMDEYKLYSEDYIAPFSLVNTKHNLIFTLGFRY